MKSPVLEKRSHKQEWILLVRLNGTSDIKLENYGIIQAFPNVQFYDYTKLSNRRNVPANYDLTFSYSGVPAFQNQVRIAVAAQMRFAVVFRSRAIVNDLLAFNATFHDLPLVDGDDTDIRHIDPKAVQLRFMPRVTHVTIIPDSLSVDQQTKRTQTT